MTAQINTLDLEIETILANAEAEAAAAEAANPTPAPAPAAPAKKQDRKEEAQAKAPAAPAEVFAEGVLKDMIANVTQEAIEQKQAEVVAAFETRLEFEEAQSSCTDKMRDNLKTASARLSSPTAAALLSALDIDMGFVNREISRGSRFNVYALQKVVDLVVALSAGFVQNAVNRAVLKSMLTCRENGVAFNGDLALAAVSDKIRIEPRFAKHLTRHTVSQNTASTQKSSTMNALEVMGIVVTNHMKGAAEIFALTDTPQTRRLAEVLA